MKFKHRKIILIAVLALCLIGCGFVGAVSATDNGGTDNSSSSENNATKDNDNNDESEDKDNDDESEDKDNDDESKDKDNDDESEEETDIELTISGITKPVGGNAPVISKPTVTPNPSTLKSEISTITWKEGNTALSTNAKFEYGKTYTAVFTVTVNNSVNIGDITVNKPDDATSKTHSKSGNVITISIVYPATAAETTTQTPSIKSFAANTSSGNTPLTVKFTYTLANTTNPTIYLINATTKETLESPTSKTEVTHKFTTAGTYLVGLKVVDGSNTIYSSNNLTIKVTTPAAKSNITSVSATVTAPATGNYPSSTVTSGDNAKYTATVTWYKKDSNTAMNTSSDKFEANTQYTATIKLTPTSNYIFSTALNESNAKINSNTPTTFTRDSDNNITMSYTFPATAKLEGPSITFTVDPTKAKIPSNANAVTVTFTYTITGYPTSATLYFGEDAAVDLGKAGSDGKITGTKTHEYTNIGSYQTYLSARNNNGSSQKDVTVSVSKDAISAVIEAGPLTGTAPLKVTVNDKSTGTVTNRVWNFGDGSVSSGEQSTSHTYEKPGTYAITLTVSDGKDTDTATKTITVTEAKTEETTSSSANYEPFLTLGDLEIPSPFDLIAEFVRLFQNMINFDNYHFASNETTDE